MASDKKLNINELNQRFSDFLKRKNYRNTQERYRVLERIAEFDKHFSADELYFYMNSRGDSVSRATIYSTLDLLTRCAILVKHRFQGESAHFELSDRLPDHDHLICVECGFIVEFQEESLVDVQKRICEIHGFKPVKHSLQVFAVCPDPGRCEHNRS